MKIIKVENYIYIFKIVGALLGASRRSALRTYIILRKITEYRNLSLS